MGHSCCVIDGISIFFTFTLDSEVVSFIKDKVFFFFSRLVQARSLCLYIGHGSEIKDKILLICKKFETKTATLEKDFRF